MSKERLEEVIEIIDRARYHFGNNDSFNFSARLRQLYIDGHITFLIEQAERAQELSSSYKRTIKKQHNQILDLMKQNKRYRETLEFYADEGTYEPSEVQIGAMTKDGYKISKVKYDPQINTDKGEKAHEALRE